MSVDYAPKKGDILFKTGVGNFSYDKDVRPHAVTEVENTDGKIPGDALTTSFNDFGKIELIEDAGKNLRMDFLWPRAGKVVFGVRKERHGKGLFCLRGQFREQPFRYG